MWLKYVLGVSVVSGTLLLLIRKMELRLRIALPWVLFVSPLSAWLGISLGSTVVGPSVLFQVFLGLAIAVILSLSVVLVLFYRDPRRTPPMTPGTVISPADGKIIYINQVEEDQIPIAVKKGKKIALSEFVGERIHFRGGIHIGIMMSYLDVHINRAPIEGVVKRLRRIPGSFHSLKHIDSLLKNERVFSIISNPDLTIGMVQIASRFVRRIVPFVKEGDQISQGDKFGVIKFGSQVDLIIPELEDMIVAVDVGDYVKSGISVIVRHKKLKSERSIISV